MTGSTQNTQAQSKAVLNVLSSFPYWERRLLVERSDGEERGKLSKRTV